MVLRSLGAGVTPINDIVLKGPLEFCSLPVGTSHQRSILAQKSAKGICTSVNLKKGLTNVVSYGFILVSNYTYRLVYIFFYLILSIFCEGRSFY
jgi:hypothetical protein